MCALLLTSLWKFFHYSPKRCENLKKILDLPELKIVKPSDTRWLAHEECVTTVKKCYCVIITTLEKIYEELHARSPWIKQDLDKKVHNIFHLSFRLHSSYCGQIEQVSSVRKVIFEYHLKCCGCHPSYSRRCSPTCSKLGARTARCSRRNGEYNRHQVHGRRHHKLSESSGSAFLCLFEGEYSKSIQLSNCHIIIQHF